MKHPEAIDRSPVAVETFKVLHTSDKSEDRYYISVSRLS
jgi:hypothetical protein